MTSSQSRGSLARRQGLEEKIRVARMRQLMKSPREILEDTK